MLTTTEITATKQIKWERDPLRTWKITFRSNETCKRVVINRKRILYICFEIFFVLFLFTFLSHSHTYSLFLYFLSLVHFFLFMQLWMRIFCLRWCFHCIRYIYTVRHCEWIIINVREPNVMKQYLYKILDNIECLHSLWWYREYIRRFIDVNHLYHLK